MSELYESFKHVSDDEWLRMWLAKARGDADETASRLPDFPPKDVQVKFVGSALATAMNEAHGFYVHAKDMLRRHGSAASENGCFLDFGCGWGRYNRLFSKDFPKNSIYNVDVDASIIEECQKRGLPGQFHSISPLGSLPAPDETFSFAIAYSVFTHLPEHVHLHWRQELARVLQTGAILVITVQPRRFLKYIEKRGQEELGPKILGRRVGFLRHLRIKKRRGSSEWHRLLAQSADRVPEFADQYDNGDLVYMRGLGPDGGDENYGDALVPVSYLEKHWSPDFSIVDVVDDKSRFAQSVVTLKRL